MVVQGSRRFFSLYMPGLPSPALDRFMLADLLRAASPPRPPLVPQLAIMAITKRCHLRCRHCFEWAELDRPDTLSLDDLRLLAHRLQSNGASLLQFSGGEPLCRFDDLLRLLASLGRGVDSWIITSGLGLTADRARSLRHRGLTGVIISLDDWRAERHDAFRGARGLHAKALRAARAARRQGLVVALSLCATREFVSDANLTAYASLARELGAGFIQLLEPRAVGRFAGQSVALEPWQRRLLERFYLRMNHDPALESMPLVEYPELRGRALGCQGQGQRHLYVDTDGGLHTCPFNRRSVGSSLGPNWRVALAHVAEGGCSATGCSVHDRGVLAAGTEPASGAHQTTRRSGADENQNRWVGDAGGAGGDPADGLLRLGGHPGHPIERPAGRGP